MKRRLTLFVGGMILVWLLVAYPARVLGGAAAAVYSAVALGLCLFPTTLTLYLVERTAQPAPCRLLAIFLVGMLMRMVVVLGGGIALYSLAPYFAQLGFWIWILGWYLVTLGGEVTFVLAGRWPGNSREVAKNVKTPSHA